jgi:hypothetical protein
MKTLTVTEVARNFSAVMDGLETEQEEIVLVRNRKAIARLVPEPPARNAIEVLGDLYRTLDDPTADALAEAIDAAREGRRGSLKELRDPRASCDRTRQPQRRRRSRHYTPGAGLPFSRQSRRDPLRHRVDE